MVRGEGQGQPPPGLPHLGLYRHSRGLLNGYDRCAGRQAGFIKQIAVVDPSRVCALQSSPGWRGGQITTGMQAPASCAERRVLAGSEDASRKALSLSRLAMDLQRCVDRLGKFFDLQRELVHSLLHPRTGWGGLSIVIQRPVTMVGQARQGSGPPLPLLGEPAVLPL